MRVRLVKRGIPDPFYVDCFPFEFSAGRHSYKGECGTKKVDKPKHPCAINKDKNGRAARQR
jgi:hypothetical protein